MDWSTLGHLWVLPVALTLLFAFSNGFRDSSTIAATVVSTGALSPNSAFALCALFEFLGALLLGTAITATMSNVVAGSSGLPSPGEVTLILSAALLAALVWGMVSWWRAWPTSNSQALIGGIAGADWVLRGGGHFFDPARAAVFVVLIAGPLLGFLVSILVTAALRFAGEWMTPRAKAPAKAAHVLGCLTVSAAHGSNDGQMAAALIAMALAGNSAIAGSGEVTMPIRFAAAAALGAGVLFGGRRILRRMGMKFFRIRDVQGVGAQVSAAVTILSCGLFGFPASTTQVVSGSIVGAGVAKNARSVRWLIVREIAASWIITLPATAVLSAVAAEMLLQWGKP